MEGRSRHCPHLGLKHTRSIRFSSPTPEHRCYIFGEPLEIQVDQRTYCLGDRYPECPRFAGQEAPPAAAVARPARAAAGAAATGGFWKRLSRRDRILYLSLLGLLLAIVATYGIIAFLVFPAVDQASNSSPTASLPPTLVSQAPKTVRVVPTGVPTAKPTLASTTVPTGFPTVATVPPTTAAPPTVTPPPPTVTPRVTVPPGQPTATSVPVEPTGAPEGMWSTLYFLGPSKAYFVPVNRQSSPSTEGVARRALELMVQGPLAGTVLLRSMPAGMGLNNVYREGGTLFVDVDHTFEELGAGQKEAMAVVLAMTEFVTVDRVQFLVNGQPYGLPGSGNTDPVGRPAYVNFEDPYSVDPANAVNLVLYFATPDGRYLFPIVRRMPSTDTVAQVAIEQMIKGPSAPYQGVAISLIPAGTQIRSIVREGNTIVVDFNVVFLQATNRDGVVKALIFAMTDLTADEDMGVDSVRISVEGNDLGAHWGSAYSGNLYRSLINPETP